MDKVLVLEIITHGLGKDLAKGVRLVEAAAQQKKEDEQEIVYLGVVESPYSLNERIRYISKEGVHEKAKRIVVIDHHRQTNERIDGAVLSYIEPYASSACEMVAEILQYYNDGVKLKNIEADAIYAGIVVDTDHFNSKTGIRTFEAAAFLRKSGADAVRVRKMFREDIEDYRVSADSIAGAEVFMDHFAISECTGKTNESLNVVAAQTANSLLNINGIKASFVMAEMENKIYISARSIDEINVQIIMEKLGGGGHMNIAGAQVEGYSSAQVRQMLKNTIQAMKEKGEI